ncbi:MAG: hypothetical protein E7467_06010 [Ruminococcaceae bacterium]|nr:hypothetical protein [Oscillospiraceae bacterium]
MERFTLHEMKKQNMLQLHCPIHVHCSRQCTHNASGSKFVQLRMVNRSERIVCDVYISIEGTDYTGKSLFKRQMIVIPNCNAQPHSVFGEERLISLGVQENASLIVTVETVSFADGMLWRRLPSHRLTTDYRRCSCALLNAPNAVVCDLCGKSLRTPETIEKQENLPLASPKTMEPIEPIIPVFFKPQPYVPTYEPEGPIVRQFVPTSPPIRDSEQNEHRWLKICFATLAVLIVLLALLIAFRDDLPFSLLMKKC